MQQDRHAGRHPLDLAQDMGRHEIVWRADRERISSRTSMIWRGSRPLVGSSRISSSGSLEQGLGDHHALTVASGKLADRDAADRIQGEPRTAGLDRALQGRAPDLSGGP